VDFISEVAESTGSARRMVGDRQRDVPGSSETAEKVGSFGMRIRPV